MTSFRPTRGPVLAAAVTAVLSLAAPPALAAGGADRPAAVPPGAAPTAQANPKPKPKPQTKPDDFDGDGYRDIAVAAPSGTVNGVVRAGHVSVLYGSKSGAPYQRRQLFHQDLPGVPGGAETGDGFGEALATGDLDRDGYTDLIVGTPGEDIGSIGPEAGTVVVIWGGRKGLAGSATLMVGPGPHLGAGKHLAVGDFDGDGDHDLATAEGGGAVVALSGPFGRDGSRSGRAHLENGTYFITGLATGDIDRDGRADLVGLRHHTDEPDSRHLVVWKGGPRGAGPGHRVITGTNGLNVPGGDNLDMGDVNGDRFADIVMGRRDGYDSDLDLPRAKGGMVTVVPGSAQGAQGTKATQLNQDSPGIPGAAVHGDYFGSGISVADIDGDGYEDVSAGIVGKDVDGLDGAGAVVTLRGSAKGLTGAGARLFSQSTPGVPGASERFDRFGANTRLLDLDGDRRAELITAATGENERAGALWVFRATRTGITASGSVTFGNGTLGAVAAPGSELGRTFGR
ncbi:FG-GAP repeat protein [Streptomyces yaizuensis]|uniref:VCBS repeat-containing protein n=1 Tax=Streptomyces yaizuensis TaxID=2989713 RepID=A0ABQ5NY81_9ACTN|nr:FG-GAP repeat protein [Streptomyces sp. YSPA8]GLF95327.1 VCBS repeat-containing protein [Streptomyces sp. YSPA8]